MKIFNRALVSTSNKDGLVEFLRPLAESGCEIVSTGGTSQFLRDHKIKVTEVAEVTGFPEIMDGRVRTLHPKIHMGLLARSFVPKDFELLKKHGAKAFDLVVVNLYPFAEAVKKNLHGRELIEQIDIGGPSLLRAAAKSFERLTVVCEPQDYPKVLSLSEAGQNDEKFRQSLAAKVFAHCSKYDELIGQTLGRTLDRADIPAPALTSTNDFPESVSLNLQSKMNLRYGENPHQKAAFYKTEENSLSLHLAVQKQGKELSYNNLMDLEAAVSVVTEFEKPACVVVKHNSPCGVAESENAQSAYKKAFEADSVSAFGGIVAINKKVDLVTAESMGVPFLECIIAPGFEESALKVFSQKKNLRVLELQGLYGAAQPRSSLEFKSTRGGFLVQESDGPISWQENWKVLGDALTEDFKADLLFSLRVVKHVKSNAIVVAALGQTLGICGGQTNRVDSVKMALERALKNNAKGSRRGHLVLASDAFFPFRDSIDLAAQNGVKWIIQPGGSMRDQEVEQAAREQGIGMVITGRRHFKH